MIRALLLCSNSIESSLTYLFVLKEMVISILTALFLSTILYLMMGKEIQIVKTKVVNYAFTDGLTGLYNRHYLNDFLEKFTSLRKEDSNFTVVFIDIDKFKEVNDKFGHMTGDCVLKSLALKLKSLTRKKDILCRYGGEEFVIIYSDISKEDSLEKAEGIRESVQNMLFKCKQANITVSVGLSFGSRDDDINRVMEESDQALYMAKNAGRNCVKVFTPKV